MPSLGPSEMLAILIIALLVFGPARLPELARGIGNGLRQLREGMTSMTKEAEDITSIVDQQTTDSKKFSPPAPPRTTTDASPPSVEPVSSVLKDRPSSVIVGEELNSS